MVNEGNWLKPLFQFFSIQSHTKEIYSMKRLLVSLFILTLLLSACGGPAAPTAAPAAPTVAPIVTTAPAVPVAATAVPAATKAPVAATAVPPTAAPTATSVPAAAPAPSGNAKDAIIAAIQATLKAGPYRTKSTIVSNSGTINMTGEMIPPDKVHTTMKSADFEMENVIIGDQGWIKQNGKWAVSPMSSKTVLKSAFLALTAEQLDLTISDAKALGTEAVNGEQARVYTYTSTTDMGESGKAISAVKVWVSVKRGLPVKQEIAGEAGGIKSTTVQMIEYDPTISIVPPM
jgi:hypothetical protein